MGDSSNLKRSINGEENDLPPYKKLKNSESEPCASCEELSTKVSQLEEKLDKQSSSQNVAFDVLNNKLDKLIRILSDVHEQESKVTKAIANLNKAIEESKPLPPARSVGAFLQNLQGQSEKAEKSQKSSTPPVETKVEKRKPVDEMDELRWCQNVYFFGQSLSQMLQECYNDDQLKKMKSILNMKIYPKGVVKVGDLYNLQKQVFNVPLPAKVTKVVLFIGEQDLFDESLLTLKQASLEDVKQNNKRSLEKIARQIKAMGQKLLEMRKQVIYIIPVTCVQRKEVFQQFEEVVMEVLSELKAEPNFKILNLPELMYIMPNVFPNCILFASFCIFSLFRRSTIKEFNSKEEHLNTWFADRATSTLSDYGCRRLMDSLKRTG